MSEIELAVKSSKKIETLLTEIYQAVGKGLHEKTSSVEDLLNEETLKRIRYIASVRNQVVHDDNYVMDDIENFRNTTSMVIEELEKAKPSQIDNSSLENRVAVFVEKYSSQVGLIFALALGVTSWMDVGIGAGITFAIIGFLFGKLICTKTFVHGFFEVMWALWGLIIIGTVIYACIKLWGIGKLTF